MRKTLQEWQDMYAHGVIHGGYKAANTLLRQECKDVGYAYMTGEMSIQEVYIWVLTIGSHYPFDGWTDTMSLIASGSKKAIKDGVAVQGRVQPEQDEVVKNVRKKSKKV